jgi:putative membrane protein
MISASILFAGVTGFGQAPGTAASPSMPAQQPMATAGSPADSGFPNAQTLDDKEFLRKALQGDEAEVQLGQLAEQKSQSDDVKQFGQKMVQDHTELSDQVKPIAQQLDVRQPKGLSKKDKQLVASLEGLSGPQFDQEYIKAMVKDHEQDLKEFKSEATMSQDPNVKKVAEEGSNLISQHLQLIEQIAQKHNVETASR